MKTQTTETQHAMEITNTANLEWERWQIICNNLSIVGAVTPEDLRSKQSASDTDGQRTLQSIRSWGESLVALRASALLAERDALRAALKECITHDGALAWKNAENAGRRLESISNIARTALAQGGAK